MLKEINIRFFMVCNNAADDIDLAEVTESCFLEHLHESDQVEYERNTIAENGCRQVCLTLAPMFGLPDISDLETI